jgi:hypothetical protein
MALLMGQAGQVAFQLESFPELGRVNYSQERLQVHPAPRKWLAPKIVAVGCPGRTAQGMKRLADRSHLQTFSSSGFATMYRALLLSR